MPNILQSLSVEVPVILQSLDIMWKGMLSIFIVIFIIALATVILQKVDQKSIKIALLKKQKAEEAKALLGDEAPDTATAEAKKTSPTEPKD